MIDSYVAGLVVTAGLLLIGHWFPWPGGRLTMTPKGTLLAYSYGVASIVAGQAIWLLPSPLIQESGSSLCLLMASFALVAGLATGLAYGIDWILRLWIGDVIHERANKRR